MNDVGAGIERFIIKQKEYYRTALNEINNGKKITHWMWFIFPQLKELGRSTTAKYYGIKNGEEAKAYLIDDYLRNNLFNITHALLKHTNKNIKDIMGEVDSLKLRSCMTLFEYVSKENVFREVLDAFYDGKPDELTLRILDSGPPAMIRYRK